MYGEVREEEEEDENEGVEADEDVKLTANVSLLGSCCFFLMSLLPKEIYTRPKKKSRI